MFVEMLVQTTYRDKAMKPGDQLDVDATVAKRWQSKRIATLVVEEGTPDDGGDKYAKYSAKDLYKLCKDQNIKVEPKQDKEYYIAVLEGTLEGFTGYPGYGEKKDDNTGEGKEKKDGISNESEEQKNQ